MGPSGLATMVPMGMNPWKRRVLALGAAGLLGAFLPGCEPVEFGTGTDTPKDTAQTGEATLVLYNQRLQDPGDLVFLLYPPATQNIEDVVAKVTLPAVALDKSVTVKVAPGRWKIGYRMESTGDLKPMPGGIEAENSTWPVVVFAKGKSYQLVVETDEGNHTKWTHNIPVE